MKNNIIHLLVVLVTGGLLGCTTNNPELCWEREDDNGGGSYLPLSIISVKEVKTFFLDDMSITGYSIQDSIFVMVIDSEQNVCISKKMLTSIGIDTLNYSYSTNIIPWENLNVLTIKKRKNHVRRARRNIRGKP